MVRTSTVGECPNCGRSIPRGSVLIEYENATGRTMYAECIECEDVVRPE